MSDREPIRVGFLDDTPRGVDRSLVDRALGVACSRARETGRFAASLELVMVRADGLPRGTARAVEEAFDALAAADVVAILGPAIGDDALVATPLADARAVPTLNFAGTERARGEYMFHLQIGSHEEEPPLLAHKLVGMAVPTVAMLFERGAIGERYASFFESACVAAGLDLQTAIGLDPGLDPAPGLQAALADRPAALVYLGLGLELPRISAAVRASGFTGTLVCNSCGMFGWAGEEHRRALEGWHYVDVFSEENPAFREARAALGLGPDEGPTGVVHADLATLLVEGLAHAPTLSRAGLRDGLERVKAIPAALGRAGTQLGFGAWDRGALKGPYLVPRLWRRGRSVEWTT